LALKKSSLKARYISIKTKDLDVLEQRLFFRNAQNQQNDEDLTKWMNRAKEKQDAIEYDYTIVNDDLEEAYEKLKNYCLNLYRTDFENDE
jgi:guanylate kinase